MGVAGQLSMVPRAVMVGVCLYTATVRLLFPVGLSACCALSVIHVAILGACGDGLLKRSFGAVTLLFVVHVALPLNKQSIYRHIAPITVSPLRVADARALNLKFVPVPRRHCGRGV